MDFYGERTADIPIREIRRACYFARIPPLLGELVERPLRSVAGQKG